MRRASTLTAIVGLMSAAIAAAQTDSGFTYQGQLKQAGVPANGNYDLRFRLFGSATGGSPITQPVEFEGWPVSDGLFTVQLHFGTSGIFTGGQRWVQVEVRLAGGGPYTVLAPRQPITPVPYALYAYSGAGDGGFSLPFTGSFAGSEQSALTITQTGVGYTANFNSTNANNYYGSLGVGAAGQGASLFVTNSGTGSCARLQNVSQANDAFPTVHATTFGLAPAVVGDAGIGTNGTGVSGVGRGTGHGVRGLVEGTGVAIRGVATGSGGKAGYFEASAAANNQFAVQILSAGNSSSRALDIVHSGTGRAVNIQSSNAANALSAVRVDTNSTNSAVAAVAGVNTGGGRAGLFQITSASNSASAVHATTSGTGSAVTGEGPIGISGKASTASGYGGSFAGSGFLGGGRALISWGDAHLLGAVGVGTQSIPSGVRVAVNGKVLCTELEVQLAADWPDYVFEDDYELMPLSEVSAFIKREKHLPGIPSAAEIREKGLAVGQMQVDVVRKIEELTLHLIALDAQVSALKEENAALRAQVGALPGGR